MALKSYKKKLIVAGDYFELIEYQEPVFYNHENSPRQYDRLTHSETRRDDNLFNTRQKILYLIESNKREDPMPKFVTFTFKENIKDLRVAHSLWAEYIRRANSYFGLKLEYLVVVEFQKRGAVHYHAIYFNMPYMQKERLKWYEDNIWKNGFMNFKSLRKVKKISAYIAKYLQKENLDKRLVGEKAYFCSQGLYQPKVFIHSDEIAQILDSSIIEVSYRHEYNSDFFGKIKVIKGRGYQKNII